MNLRKRQSRIRVEENQALGLPINVKTVVTLFFTLIVALAVVFGAQAVAILDLQGGGNLINVPGDYTTIQAAINAAATGDIIQVRPGVYYENLTITKPISLVAASFDPVDPTRNNTVIDGGAKAATITIPEGLPQMPVIHGFVIRNSTDGILAYSEFISEYNYLYAANNLTSYQKGSGGVNRNNVYFRASNNAIRLDNMDRPLLIENNRIMYNTDDGIEISLQKATAPFATAMIDIRNNMILGNGGDGIQVIQHPGNPPDSNRRFMIAGNLIANNRKAGLGFMPNANTIEDYSAAGLAEAVRVFNNTFYGNDLGISGGGNLVTFNNIIANSATRGAWRVQEPQGGRAIVAYTLFHNNRIHMDQSHLGVSIILDVDPLFEAAPNAGPDGGWGTIDDDFSGLVLRADSPAIDKGVTQFVANNGELIPPTPITVFTGVAPDLGWREVGAPIFTTPVPTLVSSVIPPPTMTAVTLTPLPTATAAVPSPTPVTAATTPSPTSTTLVPSVTPTSTILPTATFTATATPPFIIQSINPIGAQANTTVIVTISGSGFQNGAVVTFEGGQGLPQEVLATQVLNSNTIMVTVSVKNDGAFGTQVWDVRVTNPDQSTTILPDAFTVTPG
jgi:Right handed beta helix region